MVVIAYSAVGFILARLGQTFIVVRFTVDTKEPSGTGTSVLVAYVLHVKYAVAQFQNQTWKVDSTLLSWFIFMSLTKHVPPFWQGVEEHSLMFTSQLLPVKSGSQAQM